MPLCKHCHKQAEFHLTDGRIRGFDTEFEELDAVCGRCGRYPAHRTVNRAAIYRDGKTPLLVRLRRFFHW